VAESSVRRAQMTRKASAPTKSRKPASATAGRKPGEAARKVPAAAKEVQATSKRPASRADLGAPVEGWFARQPQPHRAILDALRELVREAAPEAQGSLKWGMPFYTLGGGMMCALTSHKTHVNLVLSGPSESFADPDGRLEGAGKTGRHLKLRTLEDLPREPVRRWLRTAASFARRAGA
jgi:hypothetical protein